MDELGGLLIAEVRHRIVAAFLEQVRVSLGCLTDAELWARANERSNSVGNLVLHLCGSSRHFLGRLVGGSDYVRDRPGEFARREPLARPELLRVLEETVAEHARVLDGLLPERLSERKPVGDKSYSIAELLLRVSHHWAVHVGQIVFHAKALHPEAIDEVWMKTIERR